MTSDLFKLIKSPNGEDNEKIPNPILSDRNRPHTHLFRNSSELKIPEYSKLASAGRCLNLNYLTLKLSNKIYI